MSSRALGGSVPTLDRWLSLGCPIVENGSNDRPYKFSLEAVKAWRSGVEAIEAADEAARQEIIKQSRLELVGGRLGDSPTGLTPDAKRKL